MAERMTFMIEEAKIIFRNFAGKEGMYNKEGDRNFSVLLDEETAARMAEDGWNVKQTKEREDGEGGDWYIPVSLGYKNSPPKVVLITSSARSNLGESSVEVLDYADIQTADLICNAYEWTVNGKSGIKAYLKSLFVTINEDELERKYAMNGGD